MDHLLPAITCVPFVADSFPPIVAGARRARTSGIIIHVCKRKTKAPPNNTSATSALGVRSRREEVIP